MDFSTISPRVKTTFATVLIIWLVALGLDRLAQAGISFKNLNHWQNPVPTTDTITVNGEGKVTAIPDIAMISLSVESRGKTVNEVQTDGTKKMNDIVSYLKGLDIDKKDIRTTQYSLSPVYVYNPKDGRQSVDGYQLAQTVEVKIRKLDKAGDVLAGAIDKGANQVGQLSFSIDNPEKLQAVAREQAIGKARAKAESLARAAGIRLGKIRTFSENTNSPTPYPIMYGRDMMLGTSEYKATPPPVEAGSQEVVVNVSLSFEIE